MIYFDTSALVPCYTRETRSAEANALMNDAHEIVLSDLCIAEFYVVIWRKARDKILSRNAAQEVCGLFEEHMKKGLLKRIGLTERHVEIVQTLSAELRLHLRTLDALHLAVALDTGADLATFDARLAEAGRVRGMEVLP